MTADNEPILETRKKSLLEKYDIPISHLDFEYIKGCTNVVELERIIRILRSNEEGSYPELLRSAEVRLGDLSPDSKVLRTFTPVLTKNQLPNKEWKALEEDLISWKNEVSDVERKLSLRKDCSEPVGVYPQIRRTTTTLSSNQQPPVEKVKSKQGSGDTDYRKWDMFDAESECLKLDLAEEKEKEEKQRKELEEKKRLEEDSQLSLEEKEIQAIAGTVESLSNEERQVLSLKEKDLGNEFYQTNRLDNALRHYTRSIFLHPSAASYNNRAATYLKQCRFSKALEDLNVVLEIEPKNVKAHYRRAMAYQHKNEFQKALDDILEVLKYEPKHVLARHVADQLRENCASLPRKLRIKVRDENNPSQLIVKELTEDELKRDYQDIDYLEVNDNGLPKIMCNCNGKYTNDPIMKNNDPLKYQHMWSHREKYSGEKEDSMELERNGKRTKQTNNRLQEISVGINKRNKPHVESSGSGEGRRLEIVELEKIAEEEPKVKQQQQACIVTDMRSEAQKKVFFGDFTENDNTKTPKTKDEKMNFNTDIQASQRMEGEPASRFSGSFAPELSFWGGKFGRNKPQSPPSNSSMNGEFSSEADSDDDFPEDSSCKSSIRRVEKLMDNDVDTISKDFFPEEDLPKCECGEGYRLTSSQFENKWNALETSPSPLDERSRLIRLLCPDQLSAVIGSKLDEQLLSGFFTCLSCNFDPDMEKDKIINYLESISRLQRFRIITSFLSSKDRAVVDTLLKKLHPVNNNIEEAFVPLLQKPICTVDNYAYGVKNS